MKREVVIISLIALAIFLGLALVYGASIIKTSGGSNSTTMSDDTDAIINISVNITTAGTYSNVTAVMINLSQLVTQANVTATVLGLAQINTSVQNNTVSNYSVTVTNSSINWTSGLPKFLINDSDGGKVYYFWFNLSALAPVKNGNISVNIYRNGSLYDSQMNISLNINDTFNVNFIGNAPVDYANISQNYIHFAINVSGNETGTSVNVSLSNSTGGGKISRSNTTLTGYGLSNASGFILNFSNLVDGTYYLNVTVNSTPTLDRNESLTRRIIIDRTAPTVTLAEDNTSSTKTQIEVDITVTDSTSGIQNTSCSVTNSNLATLTGSAGTWTLTETGLSCGTSRAYTVACTDHAGNLGTSTSLTVLSDPCTASSDSTGAGGGGGGGSSGSTTTWTNTIIVTDTQLTEGFGQSLKAKERVKIKVSGVEHTVGVKSIAAGKVTIEVASDPVVKDLKIGEESKFDLNKDGYYDTYVKLNSITDGKADLTIKSIYEKVPATESSSGTTAGTDESTPLTSPEDTTTKSSKTLWIVGLIVLIIIVAIVVAAKRRK